MSISPTWAAHLATQEQNFNRQTFKK